MTMLLVMVLVMLIVPDGAGGLSELSDFKLGLKSGLSQVSESEQYLKTGTTIVGLSCRDGVVLAADTRSTSGPLVMDKEKLKVHPVAPRIFACAAGTSADCDQLSRRAGRKMAVHRLQRDVAGVRKSPTADRVLAARAALLDGLLDVKLAGGRIPSAVFLLGGVDDDMGPQLYQIEADGVTQRARYAALGSGALDAIAVIEQMVGQMHNSLLAAADASGDGGGGKDDGARNGQQSRYHLDIGVEEATNIARKAVQAGILNDLGSGSHVDLCVIKHSEVERWRELHRTAHERRMADSTPPVDADDAAASLGEAEAEQVDATAVMLESDRVRGGMPVPDRNELLPTGVSIEFL